MKTVKISEENQLCADAPSGFVGEFAAIPNCIDIGCKVVLICRKHGSNSLQIGEIQLKAFHDEKPEQAILEAVQEGLGENLEDWLFVD